MESLIDTAVDAAPLAERMRPTSLDDIVGQVHLVAPGAPLRTLLEAGRPPSMILWGPPGTGKTTLARVVARHVEAQFLTLSAVMAGVKDIREAVAKAQAAQPRRTVLFIDEIHRFNKGQQDALLPYVEDGTLILIGATTENPSFELNSALLSRGRVFVLKSIAAEDLRRLLDRALQTFEGGVDVPEDWLARIVELADGDARRSLVLLETVAEWLRAGGADDEEALERLLGRGLRRFDKGGENFYDQISALHKSVRGSNPDAALYWFSRMLDGGADAAYLGRRLTRMAVEDIGLADPRALPMCLQAWDAYERLGSPEGDLALAQAVVYLAVAPKSNAAYMAFKAAKQDVEAHGSLEVPMHLRNAPTRLMKGLGYGAGYRYDHDEAGAQAVGQTYFPSQLEGQVYYAPVSRGLEIKIGERLAQLRGKGSKT